MQIVFVHYHLNAGGVTQVIVNQLRALALLEGERRPLRVGVLYGGRDDGWPTDLWHGVADGGERPFEEVLMPLAALDYDQLPTIREVELADEVADVLAENGFPPDDTLLHVHNHALGKNVSWPGALRILAGRGYRLLLQIHDFIEDFRPANYRLLARAWDADNPEQVALNQYPQSSGIHYATLTRHDNDLLSAAGVPAKRLHVLSNPVGEFVGLKPYNEVAQPVRETLGIPANANLVLYPVRGIRRKNLGELLLHAAISPADTWHAVTLAPQNPLEMPSFDRWRALSKELSLRCLFDTCGGGPAMFLDVLAASDTLITTSVAEGFGMVFLEAWLAGKPLIGRDLPNITCDFKAAGIDLDRLYGALLVPLSLIDSPGNLREAMKLAYEWACDNYDFTPAASDRVEAIITELMTGDRIDFALLPSRFQEQVIRQAARDSDATRTVLLEANPALATSIASTDDAKAGVEANAKIVRDTYSLLKTGNTLSDTYGALQSEPCQGEVQPPDHGASILTQFLNLDRLHAIRFEE